MSTESSLAPPSATTATPSGESQPRDFIRQIIRDDLSTGKHHAIRTRFPPEPNGYLHIGHAKAICLNFGIAAEFIGWCNLRLDDTNPGKEDPEFVEGIKDDVRWLGYEWHDLRHASDYFEVFYRGALKLIEDGHAYVDDLSAEDMRQYRGTLTEPGRNSPYRDRPVAENLELFKRMRAGEFADGSKTLRAKIDMTSGNMNMRDPAIYRIRKIAHQNTGDAWPIYPMYDYAHCLSDALEGITHSLCTLEFEDHRPLYDWFVAKVDLANHPELWQHLHDAGFQTERCGDWVGLASLWTREDARGRGLGTAVLRALVEWGAEHGATSAYLQVVVANDRAAALYERHGFEEHHRYDYLVG